MYKQVVCLMYGLRSLLTLGVHAPQGYSIAGCVCVSGSISPCSNESAKKTIRSLQHCKNIHGKREGVHKTASLQSYRIHDKVTNYLSSF